MMNGSDENPSLQEEIRSLKEHVSALERRITKLETGVVPSRPVIPPEERHIESRLGLLWVNRIGAITLAFGVLFLFKYAIDRQWITIWGRIILGLIAGVLLAAFSEWLRRRDQRVFSQGVYGCGIAVFYISLYFGLNELRTDYTSVAFAVCALSVLFIVLLIAGLRWGRSLLVCFNAGWALITAGLILHHSYPNAFASAALVLAIVHFALSARPRLPSEIQRTLYILGHGCVLVAAVQWLFIWTRRSFAPSEHLNITSESLSFLFAFYAVAMITIGFVRRRALDRLLGLAALGFVVLKLYFYDVWLLDRLYRISAFVALGILFLAASYLYSRWKDKLDLLWTGKMD